MATDFTKLTDLELVAAYNELVRSPPGQRLAAGHPHYYRIRQGFASREEALARLEYLTSSIRAVTTKE